MSRHGWWPWARENFEQQVVPVVEPPFTYHDVHITTPEIPRTRLFDLPYDLQLSCARTTGWQLWRMSDRRINSATLLAGEYDGPDKWLVIDVGHFIVLDSRRKEADDGDG